MTAQGALVEMDSTEKAPPASKSTSSSQPDLTKVDPGMLVAVKNMYQGKKDDDGKRSWVEELPDDLEEPVENEKTAQNALLVRYIKNYDGRRQLRIHSIVIQSPLLREALGHIFHDYPGIQPKLERLTFDAPFAPFVHRWPQFLELLDKSTENTREHLDLLHKVLEEELADLLKARTDLILNGVINYENVWIIFEPGQIVFGSKQGQPCAAKLINGVYGQDCNGNSVFGLKCEYVDWSGEQFGWASTAFKISEFSGVTKITELAVMPIKYCGYEKRLRETLIERGRKWASFSNFHYQAYKGIATAKDPATREIIAYSVDSRIIIDTMGWNRFEPNDAVYVRPFGSEVPDDASVAARDGDYDSETDNDEDDEWNDSDSDNVIRVSEDDSVFESKGSGKGTKVIEIPGDELLLLTTSAIKGYSLRDKRWLTLRLDFIKPITFSEDAFSSLVLDTQQKDLILALASSQRLHSKSFDDVVQGKGRGMIMLLAGSPGVGKTLTAESVAEILRCPLYTIGAADLGSQNWQVEKSLQNILEMCARWNAVCLIDEADVFLEARTSSSLERNKLVSIFLRTLEYYEGILFLTTNRVDNIDPAFHSRIHLSLSYPDLSPASRRRVWENFISIATKAAESPTLKTSDDMKAVATSSIPSFSDSDLDRLAAFNMNGREIKNVLKTAQLLASMKGEALTFKHVKTVMEVEQRYHGKQTELRV